MAIIIWGPVSYPVSLDTFYASNPVADGSDQVIDNHPNTIASSIAALENKLGVTGGITSGLGATAFYSVGLGINPSASNIPTVWVNTSQELIYSVGGVDTNIGTGGVGAGTTGELITWDVSGNRDAVAVGTATHVLTSNGVGVEPTFQAISTHAEVTLATSATTGGMSISTQEIGNQAAGAGIPVAAAETSLGATPYAVTQMLWANNTWFGLTTAPNGVIYRWDGDTTWSTIQNTLDATGDQYRYGALFAGEIWTGAYANATMGVSSYDPVSGVWTTRDSTVRNITSICTYGITVAKSQYIYPYCDVFTWDSGTAWTNIGNPGYAEVVTQLIEAGGVLYAYTIKSGIYLSVFKYDGGTTWIDTSPPFIVYRMAVWNGVLVAAGVVTKTPTPTYAVVYKYESGVWTQLGANLSSTSYSIVFEFIAEDSSNNLYAMPRMSTESTSWFKYDAVLDSWSVVLTLATKIASAGEFNPSDDGGFYGNLTATTTPAIFHDDYTDPVNGYLTSTDWTTFNDKADTLVYAENLDIDDGIIETVDSFNPTDDGIIMWHYQVSDDLTNMRCGTIMAVWDDSAGTVDDVQSTTAELGTTSDLALSVDYDTSLVRLRALPTGSSNWKVRVNRVSNFEV